MCRLRLARHRRAKLFLLTAPSVALPLALLAGCPAGERTSSTLRVLHAFGGADGAWPRGSLVAAGLSTSSRVPPCGINRFACSESNLASNLLDSSSTCDICALVTSLPHH
jgi:hypothetical protein